MVSRADENQEWKIEIRKPPRFMLFELRSLKTASLNLLRPDRHWGLKNENIGA
jgi:hypothetical protein